MKEQFCDYETSKKLKELGFDEECIAYYWANKDTFHWIIPPAKDHNKLPTRISIPTWQQVKQWIYGTYQAYIQLDFDNDGYYIASLVSEDGNWNFVLGNNKIHDYIEAENHAIQKSVEWLHENIEK